ncbi:hypothetical protein OROMI_012022 [Orobanche minor]
MDTESASPSYWTNESSESTKLTPILKKSMGLTSLSSIPNKSLDSSSLSLQPSLPVGLAGIEWIRGLFTVLASLVTGFATPVPQSLVSQSWSPYLRVVPKVLLVSPEPPPTSRKDVICSYSPTERIYSDDSLDSELPCGDVVPDTLDSEGGYIDYCVPESITTDSISQCDGIDEAYLKALGNFCPAVLKLLDKYEMYSICVSLNLPIFYPFPNSRLANPKYTSNPSYCSPLCQSSLVDSSHCRLTVGVP